MSNDAVIVQLVSANTEYINLLKLTAPRNLEYCLQHRFDFEMIVAGDPPKNGDWNKMHLIRDLMEVPEYKYIVWLDADTVIADMSADLRDGCPVDHIGAVRHILKPPEFRIYLDHLNVGALYLYNCPETRAFVDRWILGCPGSPEPPWWEQGVMNNINDGTVVEIDAKWNATGKVNPSPAPVVLGFHGLGANIKERFNLMCNAMGK